jgi:hypothetical protein
MMKTYSFVFMYPYSITVRNGTDFQLVFLTKITDLRKMTRHLQFAIYHLNLLKCLHVFISSFNLLFIYFVLAMNIRVRFGICFLVTNPTTIPGVAVT